MIELNLESLRAQIDLEGKYVDFSLLRTAITVEKLVRGLGVELTEATKEGECRAKCPKCGKDRSFALNINTNRFNCFAKGCFLKGGGVIDFFAKLYEVPAKEASHLLAYAYGIQPYSSEPVEKSEPEKKPTLEKPPAVLQSAQPEQGREVVTRAEFDELKNRFERLSIIVWSLIFEAGEINETDQFFDDQPDEELKSVVAS